MKRSSLGSAKDQWRRKLGDLKTKVKVLSDRSLFEDDLDEDVLLTPEAGIDAQRLQEKIDGVMTQYQKGMRWQLSQQQNIDEILTPLLRNLFTDVALEVQKGVVEEEAKLGPVGSKNIQGSVGITQEDRDLMDEDLGRLTRVYGEVIHAQSQRRHWYHRGLNLEQSLKPLLTQMIFEFSHKQRERTLKRLDRGSDEMKTPKKKGKDDNVNPGIPTWIHTTDKLVQMNKELVAEFVNTFIDSCSWKLTYYQMVHSMLLPRLEQFFTDYLSLLLPSSFLSYAQFEAGNTFASYTCKTRAERLRSWAALKAPPQVDTFSPPINPTKELTMQSEPAAKRLMNSASEPGGGRCNLGIQSERGPGMGGPQVRKARRTRVGFQKLVDLATKDVCNRFFDAILLFRSQSENVTLGLQPILLQAVQKMEFLCRSAIMEQITSPIKAIPLTKFAMEEEEANGDVDELDQEEKSSKVDKLAAARFVELSLDGDQSPDKGAEGADATKTAKEAL